MIRCGRSVALGLAALILGAASTAAAAPETAAGERLKRHLPNTVAKLEKREPVHVLVVGDGVTGGFHYGETRNQILHAFTGVFVRELAKEFFYTGGVRDVAPPEGAPPKIDESLGPEISIENHTVPEADIFYGFAPLTTNGFDRRPDLVLLNFGAGAARDCLLPGDVSAALAAQIKLVKAHGADTIVIGPVPSTGGNDGIEAFAAERVISSVMRSVARRENALFADAGELLVGMLPDAATRSSDSGIVAEFVALIESFYDHGPDINDRRHPNASAHELLGEALASFVINGSTEGPVGLSGVATEAESGFQVSVELSNRNAAPLELTMAPLPIWHGTRPILPDGSDRHDVTLDLPRGGRSKISWGFAELGGGGWLPWMNCESAGGSDRFVRLPILFRHQGRFHIAEAVSVISPVAVVWHMGNQINASENLQLGATVHCQAKERWSGRWEMSIGQESRSGDLSIAPGETGEIDARFEFPERQSHATKHEVTLKLTGEDGHSIRQLRIAELCPNIGLGKWVKLERKEQDDDGSADLSEGVRLRLGADRDALFVECELRGVELAPSSQGASLILELGIDGRYYKERGSVGFVGPLVVHCGAADGDASIHLMRLGLFGNGYDRPLSPRNLKAAVKTLGDGTRRLTVTIPRAYFYLHEWALGNGNSQLGLNANVSLLRRSDAYPDGYYPLSAQFSLTNPGMSRRDARGLATLELTETPTRRWSVRLY